MQAQEPHQTPPQATVSRSTAIKLGGLVLSALTFNWLSELWAPAAPVVIVLALVSLGLLSMSDSDRFERSPSFAWISSLKHDRLVELSLAALVLGSIIAAISLIPIWPTEHFAVPLPEPLEDLGLSGGMANNYELGAIASIVLMVTLAAYKAPSLRRQGAFLVSAIYGMALGFTYLRPHENVFILTFTGSLAAASLATVLIVALPRMFDVLKSFWGLKNTREEKPAEAQPEAHRSDAGVAGDQRRHLPPQTESAATEP